MTGNRPHRWWTGSARPLAALILLLVGLAGCGGDDPGGDDRGDGSTVAVVEAYNGFEYYGACGNETLVAGDVRYFPLLPEQADSLDTTRYPTSEDALAEEGLGVLQRVAPPGPGDDVGLLLVYEDGVARFKSDSGWIIWLSDDEQRYDWVC